MNNLEEVENTINRELIAPYRWYTNATPYGDSELIKLIIKNKIIELINEFDRIYSIVWEDEYLDYNVDKAFSCIVDRIIKLDIAWYKLEVL